MMTHWMDVSPAPNTWLSRYMLETVDLYLRLDTPYAPQELSVQAWTNLPTKFNAQGEWYAIALPHTQTAEDGSDCFQRSLRPTSIGEFELTYRVEVPEAGSQVQWMGEPGENVRLQVLPPAPDAEWTQRPNPAEILPGIYVGNFMAAAQAESLGFDAVLNMAEELNPTYAADSQIAYLKLPCRDGAQNPISEDSLWTAIAWIEQQRQQGKQRILIHCRAGIGRSGSVGIAYCFYQHSDWAYAQTLDFVWSKKPDVYPHRALQESLERLFPRSRTSSAK